MVLGIQITDAGTGETLNTDAIRKDVVHRDSTIQNPNPSIGLKPNGLSLPVDATIRRGLISYVASQACSPILECVIQRKIAETCTKIDRLNNEQDSGGALNVSSSAFLSMEEIEW